MKTIQIQYQTKEGEYLCDINFMGEEILKMKNDRWLFEKIYSVLYERYVVEWYCDWRIIKRYN